MADGWGVADAWVAVDWLVGVLVGGGCSVWSDGWAVVDPQATANRATMTSPIIQNSGMVPSLKSLFFRTIGYCSSWLVALNLRMNNPFSMIGSWSSQFGSPKNVWTSSRGHFHWLMRFKVIPLRLLAARIHRWVSTSFSSKSPAIRGLSCPGPSQKDLTALDKVGLDEFPKRFASY